MDRGTNKQHLFHRKHDGKVLEALPMLFTFTPLQQQHQAHGVVGSFSQAGGHEGVFKANGPILEKQAGQREREFYTAAAAGHWPTGFLPGYHGEVGSNGDRIGLDNLLHGMKCPCVMDLKMGTRSVESSEQNIMKKVKMAALDVFTRTAFTGVRLEGMSVHRALERGKIKTSKAQSHAISAAAPLNLEDVMIFFLTDESGVRRDVAKRFLHHLRNLLRHFETANNRYLFIGSSILLIYDNDNAAPHSRWARALERATRLHPDTYATLRRKTRVDVRMIDFAHVGSLPRGQQRDEGYITGLKTVISALAHTMGSGSCPQRPIFSVAAAAADAATGAPSPPAAAAGPPAADAAPSAHQPAAQPPPLSAPGNYIPTQPHVRYPAIPAPHLSSPREDTAANRAGAYMRDHPAHREVPPEAAPAAVHGPSTSTQEPTFFSLLGVPPVADTVWGGDAGPAGEPKFPEIPALAEGEGRWMWPGMGGVEGGADPAGPGGGGSGVFGGMPRDGQPRGDPKPTV